MVTKYQIIKHIITLACYIPRQFHYTCADEAQVMPYAVTPGKDIRAKWVYETLFHFPGLRSSW